MSSKSDTKKYCVYFYYNINDDLLYIGKTKAGVGERWQGHSESWKKEVDKIGVREYPDEAAMDLYEDYYIKKYPTKYNKAQLEHGYTSVELPDESKLSIYTISEFKKKFISNNIKSSDTRNLTVIERLEKKGIKIIEANKINFFDEDLLNNINLDKTWFKCGDIFVYLKSAALDYKRSKKDSEITWLGNRDIIELKKLIKKIRNDLQAPIDICYRFKSEKDAESFDIESFYHFPCEFLSICYGIVKKRYGREYIDYDSVSFHYGKYWSRDPESIYIIYFDILKGSFEKGCGHDGSLKTYSTVKEFIELNENNLTIDLKKYLNVYLPNEKKREEEKKERARLEQIEWEQKHPDYKEIKKIYFKCCKFLKQKDNDEKKYLKKKTSFEYVFDKQIAEVYSLEKIEKIYEGLKNCCTLKQEKYIAGLCINKGLAIKQNIFITKTEANLIIPYLKNNETVNITLPLISKFFDDATTYKPND